MGMPNVQVVYYEYKVTYELQVSQYMFAPYLNQTTGTTHCVLGIAGPTEIMKKDGDLMHLVFG
jgi:hypothetical protein